MRTMWTMWSIKRGLTTPYLLIHHLIDTAAAMVALWDVHVSAGLRSWLAEELRTSEDQAGRFIALLAGLHDIGAATPCYQDDVAPASPDWIGHDEAGYLALPTLLASPDSTEPFQASVAYRIGQLIGGHHGVFHTTDLRRVERPLKLEPRLGDESWHRARADIVMLITNLVADQPLPERLPAVAASVLAGMVATADWLACDTAEFIPAQQADAPDDLEDRFEYTQTVMRARVIAAGLRAPQFPDAASSTEVWGIEPTPLQRSIAEELIPVMDEAGLLLITTPPGTGKTRASLLAGHALGIATGRPGMFYGAATTMTAHEPRAQLQTFTSAITAESVAVPLIYAGATVPGVGGRPGEAERSHDVDTSLLAPVCVGGVDQALLATVKARHNMLRMYGLANKTLILDEVHALTTHQRELLSVLLSWCGRIGVGVVLMSATLPVPFRQQYVTAYREGAGVSEPATPDIPGPGWSFIGRSGRILQPSSEARHTMTALRSPLPRLQLCLSSGPQEREAEIERYARQAAQAGGSIAVVCNTVADAEDTFQGLKRTRLPHVDLLFLHSDLPDEQRHRITADLTASFDHDHGQRAPSVVVADQSLDSLDLDFDLVLSDLAPIATLVLRLGRCWRRDRKHPDGSPDRPTWATEPRLVVLSPAELPREDPEPTRWRTAHARYEIAATHHILTVMDPSLPFPADIDRLVRHVHAADPAQLDGELLQLWSRQHASDRAQVHRAGITGIRYAHQANDLADLTSPLSPTPLATT
ncbi:CRISPR-associated helicase Cas3' [Saccharothrix sp. Mg75]|uniref:CRISPR-associated helicase Cas3' n=1 Tax=Saccharothrix sp. Mg75 TaxID=3445357 RepID=UPI003EEE0E4A